MGYLWNELLRQFAPYIIGAVIVLGGHYIRKLSQKREEHKSVFGDGASTVDFIDDAVDAAKETVQETVLAPPNMQYGAMTPKEAAIVAAAAAKTGAKPVEGIPPADVMAVIGVDAVKTEDLGPVATGVEIGVANSGIFGVVPGATAVPTVPERSINSYLAHVPSDGLEAYRLMNPELAVTEEKNPILVAIKAQDADGNRIPDYIEDCDISDIADAIDFEKQGEALDMMRKMSVGADSALAEKQKMHSLSIMSATNFTSSMYPGAFNASDMKKTANDRAKRTRETYQNLYFTRIVKPVTERFLSDARYFPDKGINFMEMNRVYEAAFGRKVDTLREVANSKDLMMGMYHGRKYTQASLHIHGEGGVRLFSGRIIICDLNPGERELYEPEAYRRIEDVLLTGGKPLPGETTIGWLEDKVALLRNKMVDVVDLSNVRKLDPELEAKKHYYYLWEADQLLSRIFSIL
ncbi:MAG: hypothetical protein K6G07_01890 [Lachnospiraceae bacterium]|nr:hypothetical protein [Lachnospiraceae bacterium]